MRQTLGDQGIARHQGQFLTEVNRRRVLTAIIHLS